MRNRAVALMAIVVALLAGSPMVGAEPTAAAGAIRGSVQEPDGRPIAGADVDLLDPATDAVVATASTGADGSYETAVANGAYDLRLRLPANDAGVRPRQLTPGVIVDGPTTVRLVSMPDPPVVRVLGCRPRRRRQRLPEGPALVPSGHRRRLLHGRPRERVRHATRGHVRPRHPRGPLRPRAADAPRPPDDGRRLPDRPRPRPGDRPRAARPDGLGDDAPPRREPGGRHLGRRASRRTSTCGCRRRSSARARSSRARRPTPTAWAPSARSSRRATSTWWRRRRRTAPTAARPASSRRAPPRPR